MTAKPLVASRLRWNRGYLRTSTVLTVGALLLLSLFMAFPFVWMLSASLKVPKTAFSIPPQLWPHEWRWENYQQVLFHPTVPIPRFFLNDWQKFTWPLGVTMLRGQYSQNSVTVIMAGITLGVAPVLLAFLVLQRRMIESIGFTGGIK